MATINGIFECKGKSNGIHATNVLDVSGSSAEVCWYDDQKNAIRGFKLRLIAWNFKEARVNNARPTHPPSGEQSVLKFIFTSMHMIFNRRKYNLWVNR